MIYIDPTEARKGTRLPQAVIKASSVLPRLEQVTRADILVTPLSRPKLDIITDSKWDRKKLFKHTQAGALIQRKSGNDLLNSIKKLPSLIDIMSEWTLRPFLLITGSFWPDKDGYVICDGRKTKWNYNAVMGALESWQTNGGYVRFLLKDDNITRWLGRLKNTLVAAQRDEPKIITHPRTLRRLIKWGAQDRWKTTLMTLPWIGVIRADKIGTHCGSLAWSLNFASDLDNAGQLGMSKRYIEDVRAYLGLKENEIILPIKE